MGDAWRIAVALVTLALGSLAAGCGGSGGDTGTGEDRIYPWLEGPSREFLEPGGDNVVQTFGREATKAERVKTTAVLADYMRARAAKDFETECSYFSRRYIVALVDRDATRVSGGKVTTCPGALRYFGSAASGNYKNTLGDLPIVSLRLGKRRGYAQYHGNDGRDWVIPVDLENGSWLPSRAEPFERNG